MGRFQAAFGIMSPAHSVAVVKVRAINNNFFRDCCFMFAPAWKMNNGICSIISKFNDYPGYIDAVQTERLAGSLMLEKFVERHANLFGQIIEGHERNI